MALEFTDELTTYGKASLDVGDASQILTLVRKYKGVDVYPVPLFFFGC